MIEENNKNETEEIVAKKEKKPKEDKNEEKDNFDIRIEDMAKAGLHFGHRTSKLHPKMKPYISEVKNTVHIIDLERSADEFKKALKFIQKLISEDKVLLLVGTKIQTKSLVREIAEDCGLPYVNERWLGGTITNFTTIKKRIGYFKDLREKDKKEELTKYTKKERAKIEKEIKDLEFKFGGIQNLENIPDAIFVLDIRKENLAIREAKIKKIPIIGIADTNVNPGLVDYLIPANDDAISSVKYVLEKVKEVILKEKEKKEEK